MGRRDLPRARVLRRGRAPRARLRTQGHEHARRRERGRLHARGRGVSLRRAAPRPRAHLGLKLREALGADLPLSFSAGVDAANVAGVVASGFVPVTSCTDLLRPGGYQRLHRQVEALAAAMGEAGASTLPDFVRARAGFTDGGCGSLARKPPPGGRRGPRRRALRGRQTGRRRGRSGRTSTSSTASTATSACPSARTTRTSPTRRRRGRSRTATSSSRAGAFSRRGAHARAGRREGLAAPDRVWADACNDCGNCDVFCPEDGGPYIEKPRLFVVDPLVSRRRAAARLLRPREDDGSLAARGRWGGREVDLVVEPGGSALFRDGVAELRFASAGPRRPMRRASRAARARGHVVPVGHYHALRALTDGLFAPGAASWLTAMFPNRPDWRPEMKDDPDRRRRRGAAPRPKSPPDRRRLDRRSSPPFSRSPSASPHSIARAGRRRSFRTSSPTRCSSTTPRARSPRGRAPRRGSACTR